MFKVKRPDRLFARRERSQGSSNDMPPIIGWTRDLCIFISLWLISDVLDATRWTWNNIRDSSIDLKSALLVVISANQTLVSLADHYSDYVRLFSCSFFKCNWNQFEHNDIATNDIAWPFNIEYVLSSDVDRTLYMNSQSWKMLDSGMHCWTRQRDDFKGIP